MAQCFRCCQRDYLLTSRHNLHFTAILLLISGCGETSNNSVVNVNPPVICNEEISINLGRTCNCEFVIIPPGSYKMGNQDDEERGRFDVDSPVHVVNIQKPFYMSKYEVTQDQYACIMNDNPSKFKGGRHPVDSISWIEADDYCRRIKRITNMSVRLPSEAEWEYACRAGSSSTRHKPRPNKIEKNIANIKLNSLIPLLGDMDYNVREKATMDIVKMGQGILQYLDDYHVDDADVQLRIIAIKSTIVSNISNLSRIAWYDEGIAHKISHAVGEKEPNDYGLYDMYGNVKEWVSDDWHANYYGAPTDGSAWIDIPRGQYRIARGGSWASIAWDCRSSYRRIAPQAEGYIDVGIRLAMDLDIQTPKK